MKPLQTIYTLTLNPALDLGGMVDSIVPNEKNYVHSETRFPGGNAINVARLLSRLSIPVCAMGFLGGSIGNEIRNLLDEERVHHDFVEIKGHTRISITVSNKKTHEQTRLSYPGPHIQRAEINSLIKKISKIPTGSWFVIGGSFPPGFLPTDLNKIIQLAKKKQMQVVVDIPGSLLKKINLEGLTLIKPNLVEFQELIEKKIKSINAVSKEAKKLAHQVKYVCVSSVQGGALLIQKDSVWFGKAPKIKIKSTVGAGDSMVAGMVAQLWKQNSEGADLLQSGLAFATATLSSTGTQLGNTKDIRKFYNAVTVTEISTF